jgi:hypothetical protein
MSWEWKPPMDQRKAQMNWARRKGFTVGTVGGSGDLPGRPILGAVGNRTNMGCPKLHPPTETLRPGTPGLGSERSERRSGVPAPGIARGVGNSNTQLLGQIDPRTPNRGTS